MPKYHGITPGPALRKAVEAFENEVVVRRNGQRLLSKIYVDLEKAQWNIAVAYNVSRKPGIRGHENQTEVRYIYVPASDDHVTVTCSDPFAEQILDGGPFEDPDAFIRFAIDYERRMADDPEHR